MRRFTEIETEPSQTRQSGRARLFDLFFLRSSFHDKLEFNVSTSNNILIYHQFSWSPLSLLPLGLSLH